MRRLVGLGILGPLLGLAACSSGRTGLIPPIHAEGILRGSITQVDGTPIPDVHVTTVVYDHPECRGALLGVEQRISAGRSQPSGVYGVRLGAPEPLHACLTVTADPPDSVGFRGDTISGVLLDFRVEGAIDTAKANFVLEPK